MDTVGFDPMAEDPAPLDGRYPAATRAANFESRGSLLLGTMLVARGPGPHPTVVLLHGFPGDERNFDLAHVLRRAGQNVLVFHYRGSWGSGGVFSFSNVLEDVGSAFGFLRSREAREDYRVDPEGVVLVGHSMGGFAALVTAAVDPNVGAVGSVAGFNFGAYAEAVSHDEGAVRSTVEAFEGELAPLRGATAVGLVEEMLEHGEGWDLRSLAPELSGKEVLLVGATRDEEAPVGLHHRPLVGALRDRGAGRLTHLELDADHALSDKRVALARALLSWIGDDAR